MEKIKVISDFLDAWENKAREWYLNNAQFYLDQCNEFQTIAHNYLNEIGYQKKGHYQPEERRAFKEKFNNFFREEYQLVDRYGVDKNTWISHLEIPQLTKNLTCIRFKEDETEYYSYDQNFGYAAHAGKYYIDNYDTEKLNKILAKEKERKYLDLVKRIEKVVGTIQDAANLSIGEQAGELNGIIIGANGKCEIRTISAGGWNIQCFHYRVLVKKL